ncbi:MAG: SGNH/GDSL hydrolase family protein [Candidatus Kaelpia imicola]|nr:SGNH/GDSL hydrolase family protein [Candidatus Kaelpia imicola]
MKKKINKTVIILSSIVISLGLIEILLRLTNYIPFDHKSINDIRSFIYHHEDIGWCSKDPDLYWRFNEGSYAMGEIIGQPTTLNINSQGIRGPEITSEKKKNNLRIVCLGDSTTLGWEIDYKYTYEQQLQSLLNEKMKNIHFEVINAGVNGYSAYQGYRLLNKYIDFWKPDIITVYFGVNDHFEAKRFYNQIENSVVRKIDEGLRSTSYLYSLFKKIYLRNQMITSAKKRTGLQERELENEYRNNLELIIDLAEKNKAKVIFLTYPVSEEIYNDEVFPYNKLILKTAQKRECRLVDLVDAFKENRENKIFYDNIHPTPFGYSIIAKKLAEAIYEEINNI